MSRLLKVINPQTGQKFNVSHEEYQKNGAGYLIEPDSSFDVMSPDGVLGTIAGSEYSTSLQRGFKPATDEDIKEHVLKKQYGEGTFNELKALGASAVSGATFGLSDVAGNAVGIGEDLALLKRFNPKMALVGEIGGMLIPGVGQIGLAGKGASLLGKAVANKLVGEVVESAGKKMAGGFVQKAFDTGVRSAVESVAHETGRLVSDLALGNPELNAELAVSRLFQTALLGGVAGAGLEGVSSLVSKTFSPTKFGNMFEGITQKKAVSTLGLSAKETAKLKRTKGSDVIDKMATRLREMDVFDFKGALDEDKFTALVKKSGEDVDRAKKAFTQDKSFKVDVYELIDFMDDKVIEATKEVGGNSTAGRAYSKYRKELTAQLKGDFIDGSQMFKLRDRYVKDFVKPGIASPKESQVAEVARELRKKLMEVSERQARAQGRGSAWDALDSANLDFEVVANIRSQQGKMQAAETLDPGLSRISGAVSTVVGGSIGGLPGAVGAWMLGTASHLAHKRLHPISLAWLTAIEKGNAPIVRGLQSIMRGVISPAAVVLPQLVTKSNYFERVEQLNQLNPASVDSEHLLAGAPNVTPILRDSKIPTAQQFLQSKLPDMDSLALDISKAPSADAVAKLNRYIVALSQPDLVLRRISEGKASQEEIETIRTVYPQLFLKVQEALSHQMKQGTKVSQGQKRVWSQIAGVPLSVSASSQAVQSFQNIHQKINEENAKSDRKLQASAQSATATQRKA